MRGRELGIFVEKGAKSGAEYTPPLGSPHICFCL
jgi:hypothetical protein